MIPTDDFSGLELGYDIPALPGMGETGIVTPCLVIDLDALEANVRRMGQLAAEMGVRLRVHGKMHKSVDVARLQMEIGGACGVCCQKVSEAEAFVRGGIGDVLVSNEVRNPVMLDRLARLARDGARIAVCVDDRAGVADLAAAARRHGVRLDALIEIDCGAGRCGVRDPAAALAIARDIDRAESLRLAGIQAYQGAMQHIETWAQRAAAFEAALGMVNPVLAALAGNGFDCETVTGGGTGSFRLEGGSGVYTELQCGSYAFMDADYGRIRDRAGNPIEETEFAHALFVATTVMSHARPGRAVCDAGLKVTTAESGLPVVFGRDDVAYVAISDEHGEIDDPENRLKVGDRLRLVPGHCDPTCNLHDWYVGVRRGRVETLWPVSARGKAW